MHKHLSQPRPMSLPHGMILFLLTLQCVDYANQPLPSGYDLVFSRDSLQHIPMHGVWQFLNNVKASGAQYLLVGSYIKEKQLNREIAAGAHGAHSEPHCC